MVFFRRKKLEFKSEDIFNEMENNIIRFHDESRQMGVNTLIYLHEDNVLILNPEVRLEYDYRSQLFKVYDKKDCNTVLFKPYHVLLVKKEV